MCWIDASKFWKTSMVPVGADTRNRVDRGGTGAALRPHLLSERENGHAGNQGFDAWLFRKIADGIRDSGKTSLAAPRSMASRGMPNTTQVASS